MRLAVSSKATKKLGLRRNSHWPKKNVNSKKKALATKVKVSGSRVKTFTCLGTEKCWIGSKSFAFSLCQQSFFFFFFFFFFNYLFFTARILTLLITKNYI